VPTGGGEETVNPASRCSPVQALRWKDVMAGIVASRDPGREMELTSRLGEEIYLSSVFEPCEDGRAKNHQGIRIP